MPLQFIRDDIVRIRADAIVNVVNVKHIQEGSIGRTLSDSTETLQFKEVYDRIRQCKVGQAVITDGYKLASKYIIHTIEPAWQGCKFGKEVQLRSCYRNSLKLAKSQNLNSIAFPLIFPEVSGYTQEKSMSIAVSEIRSFLKKSDILISLVISPSEHEQLRNQLFKPISSYIDARTAFSRRAVSTSSDIDTEQSFTCAVQIDCQCAQVNATRPMASTQANTKLRQYLDHVADSFTEMLLHFIESKGYQDVHVYQRANIDRRLFSKIRSNPQYKPSKNTAVALAVALRLNLDQTKDLLARAGYALSPASKFDLIVEYFIRDGNYNIHEINEALFAFDESLLGA